MSLPLPVLLPLLLIVAAALAATPWLLRRRARPADAAPAADRLALLEALNEQGADLLVVIDAVSGLIVECNARAEQVFGVPAAQLAGRQVAEFMPAQQTGGRPTNAMVRALEEAVRRAPQLEVPWTWRRPDGSLSRTVGGVSLVRSQGRELIQMRGRLLEDGGPSLARSLGEIAATLSLASGEDFFVELARSLARVFDAEHVLVARFAGLAPGQVETLAHLAPGQFHRGAVTEIGTDPALSPFVQLRLGQTRVYPGNLQQLFPATAWYRDNGINSWLGVPARDSAGQAVGAVVLFGTRPLADPLQAEYLVQIFAARVATEIERRAALDALRTSEQRLLSAMADSNVAVWEWDPASDRLEVIAGDDNQFFALARSLGTMRGFLERRTPPHRLEYERQLRDLLEGSGHFDIEFSAVGSDGALVWFHSTARLESDAAGRPLLVRGMVRDITAQLASRAALQGVVERLRVAMEATGALVWEWDPASDALQLADHLRYGSEARPSTMSEWLAPLPEPSRARIQAMLATTVARRSSQQLDFPGIDGEGNREWREATSWVQQAADGSIERVIGVVRSIDERYRVQEAFATLARSPGGQDLEAFLRTIVVSLVGLFRVEVVALERYEPGPEPRMRVTSEWENGGFVAVYDYPLAGTPEERVVNARAPFQTDEVGREFPGDPWHAARGMRGYLSMPLLAGSGEVLGVISLIHSQPLRLPDWGQPLLAVYAERLALELDRYSALQALEAHREELEQIVAARTVRLREQGLVIDTIHEGVVVRDAGGCIDWVNAGAERMFGWRSAELHGQPITVLMNPGEIAQNIEAVLEPLLAEGRARAELRLRRRDGGILECLVTGTVLRDAAGRMRNIVYLVVDIAERKAVERELRRSRAELAETAAELEAFSYSVSHDLRSPLRAIDGFSQALEEDCGPQLDAGGHSYLRRIRGAAARMSQLIDDLLDLARVSRRDLDRATIDLGQLARESLDRLRERDPARAVEILIGPGLHCQGDRGLLSIVMDNLLGNAWKYTAHASAPRIEVGAEDDEGGRVFYVRDNGAGFDMSHAERLFGVFQRLHQQSEFEGTGIGLATVKRIVVRHGGRVWAEAAPGRGATFRFSFEMPAPAAPQG